MWCVSLVFSILELISNFGSLDGRCVLYIKSDAASMPVRVSKTGRCGRCGRCVVYTHPPLKTLKLEAATLCGPLRYLVIPAPFRISRFHEKAAHLVKKT